MKQQKERKTKKTLLASIIVMIVCIAMLLGTTFAWFTDSVSNTGNRIQAGTLKIDLLKYDKNSQATAAEGKYVSIANGTGDIFRANATVAQDSYDTLWEPGKTQMVSLAVENKGNLAVKYTAYIDVTDEGLLDDPSTDAKDSSLEYALIPMTSATPVDFTGMTWAQVKQAQGVETGDVVAGRITINTGVLDEVAKGETGERDYVTLAVHMKEEAGNAYQGKDAIIDVTIVATQMTAEKDGFGSDQYDAQAHGEVPPYPVYANVKTPAVTESLTADANFAASGKVTSASISKGAVNAALEAAKDENPGATVSVQMNLEVNTKAKTDDSITLDISLKKIVSVTKDGSTTSSTASISDLGVGNFQKTVANIGAGLNNLVVYHKHGTAEPALMHKLTAEELAAGNVSGFSYDAVSGSLTIITNQYSDFIVSFEGAVATIERGDQNLYFATLADAIANVQNDETIEMLKNVSNAEGMSISSGKNFTVDFNGTTYTLNKPGAGSTGTETSGFQMLSGSTITFKNGTINISEENLTTATVGKNIGRIIQCYAQLTLQDMTIDGKNQYATKAYVMSFNNQPVELKGNTNVISAEGQVAFDADGGWDGYAPCAVSINTTGTIVGNIEVGGGTLSIENANVKGGIVGTAKAENNIIGGKYTQDPTYYVKDGYKASQDKESGIWTVAERRDVYNVTKKEYYATWTKALSEATSGDTLQLLDTINPTNNMTFDKSLTIDMNGFGFVRAKEESGGYKIDLKPGCDLTMENGTWAMNATFGDITAEGSNGTCNVTYENVTFDNLNNPTTEEIMDKPGNTTELSMNAFKGNFQGGLKINATFKNCKFHNAKVEFSGYNSGNSVDAK